MEFLELLSAHMGTMAAIVSVGGVVVGFIVWLVRLEGRATTNSRDIEREAADLKEKVGLTNARVSVAETQIAELRVTAITRDDLREVEGRLTKSIDGVGERMAGEVKNLISVISKTGSPGRRQSRVDE